MKKLIECVPNFSEGRNLEVINQITREVEKVAGVTLLDVDPGMATNRTVVTFVGEPEAVVEAAFQAIKMASILIDMRGHKGEHPRMGATDVCPLIPVSGITMEETAEWAVKLAEKVGNLLDIPVYLYEHAQKDKKRSNLSVIRAGEYEGFKEKIAQVEWKPDFGPSVWNEKSGATVIGARDFLIAYNINLNTKSVRLANSIAFDVREAGRVKRIGHPVLGDVALDEQGEPIRVPGKLVECKAIGWYIEEYGIAQISMNLTNYKITSMHVAFDAVCESAQQRGIRVTGSELVGMIPLEAMLQAGKYFLEKQGRSLGVDDAELIHIAVKSLGLDALAPFSPEEKIIEYKLRKGDKYKLLIDKSIQDFAFETASESPAPGGGSIAAYCGVLGAALGTMVANLSASKRGWEEKLAFHSSQAERGQWFLSKLLLAVDEDTYSFNQIMEAFALPKNSEEEKVKRIEAIENATRYACEVPFSVMQTSLESLDLIEAMVENGNPNSITDAGVGALCIRTAIQGAFLNVKINASSLKDKDFAKGLVEKGNLIVAEAEIRVNQIIQKVEQQIGS